MFSSNVTLDQLYFEHFAVCLPEAFPFAFAEKQTTPAEKVEISAAVLKRFADYSKQNNCYTICPVYTSDNGKIFNSAVVFDRNGQKIGFYKKIHLADYEIKGGFTCGPLIQPVIKTEYGPIGIQICFDIEWDDGWTMLRKQHVACRSALQRDSKKIWQEDQDHELSRRGVDSYRKPVSRHKCQRCAEGIWPENS